MPATLSLRRVGAVALACALVVAACGGKAKPKATTTTMPPSTTTTTAAPTLAAGAAPLTGLPADPARARRPALVVKIDNAPKARPQFGLNQADVVIEEKVEDGVTRFFSIFQTQDSDPVGPVRSARSTDIALVTPLNHPLFAYSGTNANFQRLIDAAPLVDVGVEKVPGEYVRRSGRPAPYNLFSATTKLFSHARSDAAPPSPMFPYRPASQTAAPAGAQAMTSMRIQFKGLHITTVADYAWDGGSGTWKRTEDGTPHVDGAGVQVAPKNVVVAFVDYVDTGQRDKSNAIVPEGKVIGGGEAWVFTAGALVKGRWSKPTADAVMTFVDAQNQPILLTPGQTWLELPPPGSVTTAPA